MQLPQDQYAYHVSITQSICHAKFKIKVATVKALRGVNWFKKMLGESKGKRLKNYYAVLRKKDHHQFRHDCVIILVWGSWERFSFLIPLLGVLIGFAPWWVLKLCHFSFIFIHKFKVERERERDFNQCNFHIKGKPPSVEDNSL